MAIPDRDALRRKLDSLGPIEVKRRVEVGAFAKSKLPIVEQWLAEKTASDHLVEGRAQEETRAEKYLIWLKNRALIAIVVVVGAIIIGAGAVIDAGKKIGEALPWSLQEVLPSWLLPKVDLPSIPGGSGWILVGQVYGDQTFYVRGPFYRIEKSSYASPSVVPRLGDLLRLTAERNVVIVGFRDNGLTKQLMSPGQVRELGEGDYTGVKLKPGAIIEVRDVAVGRFPEPPSVWVRVAAPPQNGS